MAFNISNFKSNGLQYGGARASLFEVQLANPGGLTLNPNSRTKFTFLCESAELPGSTIGAINVPYFGRTIKLAGDRTFNDWSVTILNDEDFAIRAMMERWHNSLNTLAGNRRLVTRPSARDGYKSDGTIVTQFGKGGDVIRQYEFHGLFPTDISAIALSWDTTNQVERFTVNFTYDYFIPTAQGEATPYSIDRYATQVGLVGPE